MVFDTSKGHCLVRTAGDRGAIMPRLKRFSGAALLVAMAVGCSTPQLSVVQESKPAPKYGLQATRLYHSREHIKKSAAPDFWALMPYYVPQQNGRSCSVASVAMLINALRADQNLTAADELVTQQGILKKLNSEIWTKGVSNGGHGVTLDQLGTIIRDSLKAYGLDATVEVVHMDSSQAAKEKLRKVLAQNEKSAKDFLVANFLQGVLTGDPEGMTGHIAPIGAYDAKSKRVLIFDPDRQYYEPYWVSEGTLFKGMNTTDKQSGRMRGYVYILLAR